jgi:signal transduction histidine kinase
MSFQDGAGNWRWMEAIVTNQLNHPDIKAIVVSCRDVTPQINAESRLKEMQLLEALVEGEEKERSRIARDLHDEVLGMIAAAKMQFSALIEKKPDLYELKEYIQGMELLQAGALQVRKTSHNLMPEILLENGLDEAISRYCRNISNDKLNMEYFSVGNIERFSPNFELSLYRIVQELINNIVRHSSANSALVQLSRHTNILSLTIEDNGKGFKTTDQMNGTGLQSVKKRVEAMNGQMEIISEPGKGTSVYLEFGL